MDRRTLLGMTAGGLVAACGGVRREPVYRWTRLTEAAGFPGSYNFPVHVSTDRRFVALHPEGTWSSRDGRVWMKEGMPPSGTNSAYLPLVQHGEGAWAIGQLQGDYRGFRIDPLVKRTLDYRGWTDLGRSDALPKLVFAACASFGGHLWLLGGFDGRRETNGVWRSVNGLRWERVLAEAPWSPRAAAKAVAFDGRLWLLGGGVIDGAQANDAWSSGDGREWRRDVAVLADPAPSGFTPQVFDRRLWLVAANRAGGFGSAMLVLGEGRSFDRVEAPWSPRGGVATWVADGRMYLTGGKYSEQSEGEPRFIYSNDVWMMTRTG
ncbi:hypothetical protein [Sphingomonas sp.]|uniref:hypothetical protein n=1 Tax=Sphingomonas sp. TaxID=28214 RepID=UPI001AFE10E8|nr:hypothetical protein [Sphingomonas sp.]MBO9711314.1 hypothetical protein [Sphingomonas sp.]